LVWEWHTSIDFLGILRKIIHENKINAIPDLLAVFFGNNKFLE
jgi:hypothetical protein